MVFGGTTTITILGFILDQIPDAKFAGTMPEDPQNAAEKGEVEVVDVDEFSDDGSTGSRSPKSRSRSRSRSRSKSVSKGRKK